SFQLESPPRIRNSFPCIQEARIGGKYVHECQETPFGDLSPAPLSSYGLKALDGPLGHQFQAERRKYGHPNKSVHK
ncbi:Mediator Of Rna polymerase Ii Transcription Subunit 12, partial [Manis pentadactyla]